ncbi:hypothetical protein PLICRDRAFT_37296 [Plicaturopsis crispa FD-325 SS-3]|nr:hypothetical protein PLICRDRAFT_37296 [Plicaturopsis crispa FD-325 SS-3]
MSTTNTRLPISRLPLPPSSELLTSNLTADPRTPDPVSFRTGVLPNSPSVQRRARILSPEAHYSFVAPLPLPFPYDIEPPDPPVDDKAGYVEEWLAAREAVHLRRKDEAGLSVHYPENRDQQRELIGLADAGLRDCLPRLDVGDAFSLLGTPALVPSAVPDLPERQQQDETAVATREELLDILSGHAVLMSDTFAPWSLRYSGHQFGSWAGQLGDGRAISILTTTDPACEIQLKGAGRTPFSRSADGLAVLRSSIREYLGAEAINSLGIATTRSLSLTLLPKLRVERERVEPAAVLARLAPSFLRVGSFEAFSPPRGGMFFFGGGQQAADWSALHKLGEYAARVVLGIKDEGKWAAPLVYEVAKRNAEMVAGWQAYGFMHGVMNTDNISILGLTIDYGPYAFMDVFDPWHICNHTDAEGRYAYKHQPTMIVFALRSLVNALAPVIGAQSTPDAPHPSKWADVPESTIAEWRAKGEEEVKDEVERIIQDVSSDVYGRLMRKRLGLRRQDNTDERTVTRPLLDLMANRKLDFHGTFRALCAFSPSLLSGDTTHADKFIASILGRSPASTSERDDLQAAQDLRHWLEAYAARIESERAEWPENADEARAVAMRGANPRFVLRQWVLEEVIARVEKEPSSGKRVLAKVLKMATEPFEAWGAEGATEGAEESEEEKEERRLCEMGDRKMLGFQCSCSS